MLIDNLFLQNYQAYLLEQNKNLINLNCYHINIFQRYDEI